MKTPFSKNILRFTGLAFLAATAGPAAVTAADDAPAVIARARGFLGSDEALNAVKSLHYLGTVTNAEGATHKIEIIVRRPLQQRVVESTDKVMAVTVLNDYTGWRRGSPPDQPDQGPISLMPANEVRRMRANTWQNLSFYSGIEQIGGSVSLDGEADQDGVACHKVVFSHAGGFRFVRFFEKATGRLVVTQTEDGAESRESGEITVAGIRFPRELTSTADGKTSRVLFEEIRVNEEFADSLFEMPTPKFNFGVPRAPQADTAPATTEPISTPPSP